MDIIKSKVENKKDLIAFYIPFLGGGGAEKVVVNLSNTLVALTSHPIHVVLATRKGVLLDQLHPKVQIINLASSNELHTTFALAKYLRKQKPAVLMSSMKQVNVFAIIASIIARHPCRLVIREANVLTTPSGNFLQKFRGKTLIWMMRSLYRFADAIVINSEATKLSLLNNNIKLPPASVIGNPIEVKEPNAQTLQQSLYPKPYICSISGLSTQKGIETLLEAFSLIPRKDLKLIILGEGELRSKLESLAGSLYISDRVQMPGFIDNPFPVLRDAEAFVLASRWEGFGNVIVEALAAGTPVVCTDCPGAPRFILEDGKHGHLVPVDQPQALADGIMRTLTDPAGTPASRKARASDFAAVKISKEYLHRVLLPPIATPSQT